ncbi:protease inhibitor I9 family protein, partial [Methanosarcina sp. UBA5]|uniref:protease inhibitor I9 family protein n=1 Tax=Methanosarcina sp. UBA5 TaxID=1915593 RepID=UPI0025E1CB53
MEKEIRKPSKKAVSELLCVICTSLLFLSLFSFTALAEDTNLAPSINSNDKISASLSSKLGDASETELVPVIVMLPNQKLGFKTAAEKSKVEDSQKDIVKYLENEKSKNNVKDIKRLHIVNAVAAKVTPAVIASLANRNDVSSVELDQVVKI